MSWLVVTPAYDEEQNLPLQAAALAAQTAPVVGLWVVVDDGSTDATATCVDWAALPFPAVVLRRDNTGGLAGASELLAFRAGVAHGLERLPDAERIMKLDADLLLAPDYFEVLARVAGATGLVGGRFDELSTATHVLGGLRAYSRDAYALSAPLPAALGWDVVDEVATRRAGLGTLVEPAAVARSARTTGSSVGLTRGRYRKGVSSRWSGYHPVYALLQVLLHLLRRPRVVGGVALAWGYLSAGPGPFPAELKRHHRREQAERLGRLARDPVGYCRAAYGSNRSSQRSQG